MNLAEIRFIGGDRSLIKRVVNVEDGANIANLQVNGFQEFDLPLKKTLNDDIEHQQLADIVLSDIYELLAPITNADVMGTRFITYRNPYTQSIDPATYGPWYGVHADWQAAWYSDTTTENSITSNLYLDTEFRYWTRPGVKIDFAKLKNMQNYSIFKWWKNVDFRTDSVWKLIFIDKQTPVPQEYWQDEKMKESLAKQNADYTELDTDKTWHLPYIGLYDHPEVENYRYVYFPNTNKDKILLWQVHNNSSICPPIFHAAGYVYGETNPERRSIEASTYCWYL